MNQISHRHPRGAVALPPMPATSPILTAALDHALYAAVHDGESTPPVVIPAHCQHAIAAEAAVAAERVRQRLAPASSDQWEFFLRPLVAAVRNPPSRKDFEAFAVACAGGLQNVPAHLLVSWRQAEAVRRFAFWPAVADLATWLAAEARTERATLTALERIAATPEPTPAQRDATADAIAAVRAKGEAFRREMAAQQRQAEPNKPRPYLLTPAQELAQARHEAKAHPGPEGEALRARIRTLEAVLQPSQS